MSARASQANWVVAGGAEGEVGHCQRCGEGFRMELPQRIEIVVAASKAFVKIHARCPDTGQKHPSPATLDEWFRGRDTGISSLTIFHVMTGRPTKASAFGYAVPHDPSDFGRCYRLLQLCPEWIPRLSEVSAKFPAWKGLIENWPALTERYEQAMRTPKAPAHEMYNLMQTLIGRAEKGAA